MTEVRMKGLPASPGVGYGPAWRHHRTRLEIPRRTAEDAASERARLTAARGAAADELLALQETQRRRLSPEEAAIFDAHRLMLDDPDLLAQVDAAIAAGASAEAAWQDACERAAASLEALPHPIFKARAADVRDVGGRVLRGLLGISESPQWPDHPVVVVAEDLTPSETVGFQAARVAAFCTVGGGPTSHVAILARRLQVPAVVGLGEQLGSVRDDAVVIVDGEAGMVVVDPDPVTLAGARDRQANWKTRRAAADAERWQPATTRDGVRIEVAANVGNLADAEAAVANGAEAVGLLRTEFLYMERATAPEEDEQVAAYRDVLKIMDGRPVVFRTLDIGGDKPVPYLPLPREPNPFLGTRAIRLARRHPDLLRQQLRAILRAGAGYPVLIMFPMVATVDEIRSLRAVVDEVCRELTAHGVSIPEALQVGMMVEIPSAALLAGKFVPWVDFFSIGTNDLAQYTLAADRTNSAVADLADALHPAVLRLIQAVTDAARPAGRWVGVCGELAGEPAGVPILVGLGVSELSVNPPQVSEVKRAIRQLTIADARAMATKALSLDGAGAVREFVQVLRERRRVVDGEGIEPPTSSM